MRKYYYLSILLFVMGCKTFPIGSSELAGKKFDPFKIPNYQRKDIKEYSLPGNGLLVIPVSMARIGSESKLGARAIIEFLQDFKSKLQTYTTDVMILYTSELYLMISDDPSRDQDLFDEQISEHKRTLEKLVSANMRDESRRFIPNAFSFNTWSQIKSTSPNYRNIITQLRSWLKSDNQFKELLEYDLESSGRDVNQKNMDFILEEIAVTYLIQSYDVTLNLGITERNRNTHTFRLICYPGELYLSFTYAMKKLPNKITGKTEEIRFSRSYYNWEDKLLVNFDNEKPMQIMMQNLQHTK